MRRILASAAWVLLGAATAWAAPPPTPTAEVGAPVWLKGNTHTHTLNSDGDSSPGEVAYWYRDHGYDFLVLSDHNYFTVIEELQRELDRESDRRAKPRMILVPGEEVTDAYRDAKLHVNGLETSRVVGKQGGESKQEVLQKAIDGIRAAGGVPSVNHPNYRWSVTADDLAALRGLRHFEIYNGHPDVQNFGGGGRPSLEQMWDDLLGRGVRLFGVAVDDAHDFKLWGARQSNPGKGWIVLRARERSRAEIRRAFEAGDFYASTGVVLADVGRKGTTVFVKVQPEPEEETAFTTEFVGPGGRVLARETGHECHYALRPEDRYVRVRVVSSRQEYAWSQPFFAAGE